VTEHSNSRTRQNGATASSAGTTSSVAGATTRSAGATTRSAGTTTGATARETPSAPGISDRFREIADRITRTVGSPIALIAAITLILLWAVTGPIFGFSDSWQLIINTTTTIITFLMVFVIQTSQNRDGRAIQVKLDELIRANAAARNEVMTTEKGSEEQLNALEEEFEVTAEGQRRRRRRPPSTEGPRSASKNPGATSSRSPSAPSRPSRG
jgi:low affinity Fe/Cu permease